jgi:hypothetical protein
LDIFLLISLSDNVNINELSLILEIISQRDALKGNVFSPHHIKLIQVSLQSLSFKGDVEQHRDGILFRYLKCLWGTNYLKKSLVLKVI